MSDDTDAELDAIRERTSHGDRLDEAPRDDGRDDLQASIREALGEIDSGDRQKTVSVWDGDLAAFLAALDDHPDHRDAVGRALGEALGRGVEDDETVDRSEVLRLALRLGLAEAAPEYTDTLREAIADHAAGSL